MKTYFLIAALIFSVDASAVAVEPTTMQSSFESTSLVTSSNSNLIGKIFLSFGNGEFRGQNCRINGATNRISINLYGGLTFSCQSFIYVSFQFNTSCDINDSPCLNLYAPELGLDDDEIMNYHVTFNIKKYNTNPIFVSGNCLVDAVTYNQPDTSLNPPLSITMTAQCLTQ